MFAGNYFAASYFAPRYFPRNGSDIAYGGWPRGPEITPEVIRSYQKKLVEQISEQIEEAPPPKAPVFDAARAKNIALIRQLRAELEAEADTTRRRILRRQIEEARIEKDRLFAIEAQGDEDDAEFILFN